MKKVLFILIISLSILSEGCVDGDYSFKGADEVTSKNNTVNENKNVTGFPVIILLKNKSADELENLASSLKNTGSVIREKIGEQILVVEHKNFNPDWVDAETALVVAEPDWSDPLWEDIDGVFGLQALWSWYKLKGVISSNRKMLKNKEIFQTMETLKHVDGTENFNMSEPTGETWDSRGHGKEEAIYWKTPENMRLIAAYSPAPGFYDTSEYMIGSIAVGVVFVDGPTGKWKESWKNTALQKIQAGANWYVNYEPKAQLSFTISSYSTTVSTNPTDGTENDTAWRYEALQNLGYAGDWSGAYEFNNALRTNSGTDWAFFIFMVSDGVLGNSTKFTDGYFAFAYVGGPYQVHTDDNNGWGIEDLDNVFSHETGHTFGAGDEYCSPGYACCSCAQSYGYLSILNANCEAGCPESGCDGGEPDCAGCSSCVEVSCMMRNNVWQICPVTQQQLGWLDSDGDGIFDPVDTFVLTYTSDENGSIEGTSSQTVQYGSNGTEVKAVPDEGYHFDKWSDESATNPRTDKRVKKDITVNAAFIINTYSLNYSTGNNGSLSGELLQTVQHGSDGTAVEAIPDEGFHFVRWSDGSTDNPRIDKNVTSNQTVKAVFAINTYTVTYIADDYGLISGQQIQEVEYGSDGAAVTAVPHTGFHFYRWSDGLTDNPRIDKNVTGDIIVTAEFEINSYRLTYIAGEHGSISGQHVQTVNYGSNGTAVEAVPNEGYHFVKWSDGFTDNPRTDENIAGDITVTAEFAINTHTLIYTIEYYGSISGQQFQTVDYGSDGTPVTVVPDKGYHFYRWNDGSIDNPRTDKNVKNNINVSAELAVNVYTLTYTSGDHGSISGQQTQKIAFGSDGTAVESVPDEGCHFVKWSDGSTDNPRIDKNVTGDITVTAEFDKNNDSGDTGDSGNTGDTGNTGNTGDSGNTGDIDDSDEIAENNSDDELPQNETPDKSSGGYDYLLSLDESKGCGCLIIY